MVIVPIALFAKEIALQKLMLQNWRKMANLISTLGYYAHDVTKFQTSLQRGFFVFGAAIRRPFFIPSTQHPHTAR